MSEWLKCAVAGREVSGASPGRGGHNNLCGLREPSYYVGFRRTVKRQWFHTRKHKIQIKNNTTTLLTNTLTFYTLELNLGPFPTAVTHFLPTDQ